MKSELAIRVEHLSKSFQIPHKINNTLREKLLRLEFRKEYELLEALKNISFDVNQGEFLGIIGKNGSGKSTLLKILAGIYQADQGVVEVNGEVSPFLELGVGFNPELSGRDNIFLNATILGLSRKEIKARFDSMMAFSELERFIDQQVKNYSSGMQMRLAFSVAIHANRGILLMDEVLAVGDAAFQRKCLDEFQSYKNQGRTVILVSHDITTVRQSCDRVIWLENGEITKSGEPQEVCDAYMGC